MANEQEQDPQTDSPVAEGELDLSPVIKKKEEEDIPFEVLSTESKPGSCIEAKVQVSEADFEKRLEGILKDLRKNVVVDGFRRGHAPLRMLRNMYGKEARKETVEKMKEKVVPAVAKQNDWKLVGESELKDFEAEAGKPLVATYTFEIYPKIEVSDEALESVAVDVESVDVTDAMVGVEIDKLRQANSTFEAKAEGEAFDPENDGVAVDLFVTDPHGHNVAELSRMEEFIARPKDELPEPVVQAMAGKKAGDHVETVVPSGDEDGEPLTYHVDIQSVKTLKSPALDDEFAKDVSDKFQTFEDLRKDIRRDLEEQKEEKRKSDAIAAIVKVLTETIPFEVPQTLVMATAASRIDREEQALRKYGINLSQVLGDKVKGYVEAATQGAEASVKASLLLRAVAERKGFEVGDDDIQKEFERLGEKAGRSAMAIRAQYEARKKLDELKTELLQRKLEDFLLDKAKVTYKAPEPPKPEGEAEAQAGDAEAKAEAPKAKGKTAKAKAPKAEAEAKADEPKADESKPEGEKKKASKPRAKKAKAEPKAEE